MLSFELPVCVCAFMADPNPSPLARVLLQQCLHAQLQVKPAEPDSEARWVEVILALRILRVDGQILFAFLHACITVILQICPRDPQFISLSFNTAN